MKIYSESIQRKIFPAAVLHETVLVCELRFVHLCVTSWTALVIAACFAPQ